MDITITKIDMFAQLVDEGRRGAQSFGYSKSGAMDRDAYSLALALLGSNSENRELFDASKNETSGVCVEVAGGGIEIQADATALLSIVNLEVLSITDSKDITSDLSESLSCHDTAHLLRLEKGDKVKLALHDQLTYGYVGLFGKITISNPLTFSSICDVAKEGLGGLHGDGKGLRVGDRLKALCHASVGSVFNLAKKHQSQLVNLVRRFYKTMAYSESSVEFSYSYQSEWFEEQQKQKFELSDYVITNQRGRMGIVLEGAKLQSKRSDLHSEGIVLGSIQISGAGTPMVLMADRQTIGGYPKIGAVGGVSLSRLAQKQTHSSIQFVNVDSERLRAQKLSTLALHREIQLLISQHQIK